MHFSCLLLQLPKEHLNPSDDDESPVFPFPTEPDDHCESPLDAYRHILPFLERLFPSKSKCRIYDPYYCHGAVKCNLSELGFPHVYNENEDCYQVWDTKGKYPKMDVLLTNPPYSGDHIPRLLKHVTSKAFGNRPWFLLLPTWVHKKDYYREIVRSPAFFLVPKKRYVYVPPKNFREKKVSDVHKKSSPFVSMWYIWGGTSHQNTMLIDHFKRLGKDYPCDLARSKSALRDLRRKGKKRKGH